LPRPDTLASALTFASRTSLACHGETMLHLKKKHLLPLLAGVASLAFRGVPAVEAPQVDASMTWEAVVLDAQQGPQGKRTATEDAAIWLPATKAPTIWPALGVPGLGTLTGTQLLPSGGSTPGNGNTPPPVARPDVQFPKSRVNPPVPVRDISPYLP
jgi:hypothetical protein